MRCSFQWVVLFVFLDVARALALGEASYIVNAQANGLGFLARQDGAAPLFVEVNDYPGVFRAVRDLRDDVRRVTGTVPSIIRDASTLKSPAVLIGTIGHSPTIDALIKSGKIDVSPIMGKWESFIIQTIDNPLPGVDHAVVIVGSDKRGTIYGIYDVSEQIGVSPWYWWADVPARHQDSLYIKPGRYVQGPPVVKYRGIFLNDEAPAMSGWAKEKFGGFNSKMYAHVFELLLRLKANYLWPAMWGNAFNEDDPENPRLADEYGIVMGTSHQEAMLRAQAEFDRRYKPDEWNYATHPDLMGSFWREGVKRNKDYESIVTIGMRGRNDTPMIANATVPQSMDLLEKIVGVQRKILADEVNPDVTKIPQVWCLYKEVLEYYNRGLRVPDDVTLLWCDDNWGNIRRLPTPQERNRAGGAGIYYHFDYVGDPRNYKWINTNPLPKIQEQMNLAYQYGADRIWIVNVGDLKPMEVPIEYFMTLAWNPNAWPASRTGEYLKLWATREFGPEHADEIADIVAKYAKYNAWRKPELLEPGTFSLVNYDEADRVSSQWKAITDQALAISKELPLDAHDAFYQLVLYPTQACATVNDLYIAAAKNQLYAKQGRASTNDQADLVKALFKSDQDQSDDYNHTMAHGKWDHMMDQTRIGYTNWQQPRQNNMPAVKTIDVPQAAALGVSIEGSADAWPGASETPTLPTIDVFNQQTRSIDLFNRGKAAFDFTATPSAPWIVVTPASGKIDKDKRLSIAVDWSKAPQGDTAGEVKINGAGSDVSVKIDAFNPAEPTRDSLQGFVESNGVVSIDAGHATKLIHTANASWRQLSDYGTFGSGMEVFPVTAASVLPQADGSLASPCMEYRMFLFQPGDVTVDTIIGPTLNFVPGRGLRLAVSFDDQKPQLIDATAHFTQNDWRESVKRNAHVLISTHAIKDAGYHTLKLWMIDPAVVVEHVIVHRDKLPESYFGPPESFHGDIKENK